MILVTGTAKVKDGARDALVAATQTMVTATRAEDGCHESRYSFDISDPDMVVFYEAYESQEALQAHMRSPHMTAFYQAGQELMTGRPDVTVWVGAEKGSMG